MRSFGGFLSDLGLARSMVQVLFALFLAGSGEFANASLALFQTDCQGCHGAAPNGPNFNAAGSSAILTQANANRMGSPTTNFDAIASYIETVRPVLRMNVPYRAMGATGSATSATVGDIYLNSGYAGIVGIARVADGTKGSATFTAPGGGYGNPTANYTPNAGVCGADTFTYRGVPSFANINNNTYTTTRTANVTIANPVLTPASFSTSVAYNTGGASIDLTGHFAGDVPTTVTITARPSVGTATGSSGGANTITYAADNVAYASSVTIGYQTTACGVISATQTITLTVGAPPAPTFTTPGSSPTNAPATQTGVPYSYTVAASSSNTAAIFSVQSGALPPGLVLASNGAITGTPTTLGSTSATIVAKNLNITGTTTVLNFNTTLGPPVFTSAASANGVVGASYTVGSPLYTISATNSPSSFTASGLPAGLSLNPTTGAITGTPTAAASTSFTLTAINGVSPNASQLVLFNITAVAPVVTSTGPAPGQTGVPFSFQITATNGPSATGYGASNLPPGLTVSSSGLISGTPSTIGNYTPTLSASNASGTGTLGISMPITLGPPVITSANTASGAVGIPFSGYQITASNNPVSFSSSGLPPGLAMNASGLISGTPTGNGSFNATVGASNGVNPNASQVVTFNISVGIPAISSATTTSLQTGQAFSYQIAGTNGPSSFSATGLPTGLSMSATGLITGATYQIGVFPIALTATNGTGTGSATLNLTTTLGPPVFTSATTANIVVSQDFSYQITAFNNPTSFAAIGLPAGLVVNPGNGLVNGIPLATGATTATLSATNATGTTQQNVIFTSVNPPAPTVVARAANVTFNTATAIDVASSISGQYNSVSVSTAPAHGTTSVTGTVITYTPTNGWFGPDSLAYTATGLGGTSAPATISLTVGTQAPSAAPGNMTLPLNTSGTLDLATLIQGSGISGAQLASNPVHGTAAISGTTVTYTPIRDYFGTDSFMFVGIGNAGTSSPATVSITITGRPDPAANPEVIATLAAQQATATLFTKAQTSNVMGRMENLHGRTGGLGPRTQTGGDSTGQTSNPLSMVANAANGFGAQAQAPSLAERGGAYAPGARPDAVAQSLSNQYATLIGRDGVPVTDPQAGFFGNPQATSAANAVMALQAKLGQSDSAVVRAAGQVIGLVQGFSQGSGTVQLNMSSDSGKTPRLGVYSSADTGASSGDGLEYWMSGGIQFSKKAIGSGIAFSTSGLSVGVDKRLSDNVVAGMGLGFGRESTDIGTDGSRNEALGNTLMVYGSYLATQQIYVDALLGYGRYAFDGKRWISPIDTFATSERTGRALFASMAAGYEWRVPGLTAAPYVRMDVSDMRMQATTETGAGLYNLFYAEDGKQSRQLSVGLRGQLAHSLSSAWVMPRARLELQHSFDGAQITRMAYADQPTNLFSVSSNELNRNSVVLGLGSDFLFRSGLRFSVDYQLQYAGRDQSSQGVFFLLKKTLDGRGPDTRHLEDFELAPWLNGINFDTSVVYDDNVTRSSVKADVLSDTTYQANFSRSWKGGEYVNARHAITLNWGAERWANYHGLDRLYVDLDAQWQYRASGDFGTPIWSVLGKGVYENFGSDLRDGTRLGVGGSVWLPLTDRMQMTGTLMREARNATSRVFDAQNTVFKLGVDYNMLSSNVLYMGAEWRQGDQVSSGRPSLASLDVARMFVADDAFAGNPYTAYRFKGRSALYTLGLYVPLGGRDAIDFSWRLIDSSPNVVPISGPIRYRVNQLSIVYQQNF